MADFAANLLTVPEIGFDYTGGGSVSAKVLTVPAISFAVTGGGSVLASLMLFGAAQFSNRVFDSVAGKLVIWQSAAPDSVGARYPGPGVFGVSTSDYVLLN